MSLSGHPSMQLIKQIDIFYLKFVIIIGSLHIPAVYNAPLYKPAGDNLEGQSLPCVVFSHGLGGNRLIYSTYCCELASQGCLVACVEHRYDLNIVKSAAY